MASELATPRPSTPHGLVNEGAQEHNAARLGVIQAPGILGAHLFVQLSEQLTHQLKPVLRTSATALRSRA
jgi:hypothetical protein